MRIPLVILPGLNNSGPQHWQTLWQERRADALRPEPTSWSAPELDDWVSALDRVVGMCTVPPILIAHSLGCVLSVCWANQHRPDLEIAGAFLVAPPNFKRQGFPAPSFTHVPESPLPYPALVVASTNDPYCPIEVAAALASQWEAEFVSVGPRGRISTEPGNETGRKASICSQHLLRDCAWRSRAKLATSVLAPALNLKTGKSQARTRETVAPI